jgi:hypothetical protein
MEVELVPVRGEARLYWRLGKSTQSGADGVLIRVVDGEFSPGERYTLTASYVGSRRLFTWSPNAWLDPEVLDPINWRRSRVGAFGAVLGEQAELRITKLRIRVLRAGS